MKGARFEVSLAEPQRRSHHIKRRPLPRFPSAELSPSFAVCCADRSIPDLLGSGERQITFQDCMRQLGRYWAQAALESHSLTTPSRPAIPPFLQECRNEPQKISALTSSGTKHKELLAIRTRRNTTAFFLRQLHRPAHKGYRASGNSRSLTLAPLL
jgi:hypothetical protein